MLGEHVEQAPVFDKFKHEYGKGVVADAGVGRHGGTTWVRDGTYLGNHVAIWRKCARRS